MACDRRPRYGAEYGLRRRLRLPVRHVVFLRRVCLIAKSSFSRCIHHRLSAVRVQKKQLFLADVTHQIWFRIKRRMFVRLPYIVVSLPPLCHRSSSTKSSHPARKTGPHDSNTYHVGHDIVASTSFIRKCTQLLSDKHIPPSHSRALCSYQTPWISIRHVRHLRKIRSRNRHLRTKHL